MRIITLAALAGLATGLAGCSWATPIVNSAELCKSWRHQTVSKNDKLTQPTAEGIEGSNKARPAWGCSYGKDEPAKG